jgi:hypothetical protein
MTHDKRVEAAIDAVIKARGWRDSCWGDGAIGGYNYSTPETKRYVIRDHEAEARAKATVILFETDSHQEYEREFKRACIRRELSAALAAADAAAWRNINDNGRPSPGEWVLIMSRHFGEITTAVAMWDSQRDCWSSPELEMRYSHVFFYLWRCLPAPPADTQEFGGRDG